MSELSDSYARCEAITRAEAANFYYGIRLLPPPRRRALCAAYAFARRIDDIGDGELPAEEKLRLLEQAEVAVAAGWAAPDRRGDPVLVALEDATRPLWDPAGGARRADRGRAHGRARNAL